VSPILIFSELVTEFYRKPEGIQTSIRGAVSPQTRIGRRHQRLSAERDLVSHWKH